MGTLSSTLDFTFEALLRWVWWLMFNPNAAEAGRVQSQPELHTETEKYV